MPPPPPSRLAPADVTLDAASLGVTVRALQCHTDTVVTMCVAGDGRLVTASSDRAVRVWRVASGVRDATLVGHTEVVASLCALLDGSGRVVAGSYDGVARLYELDAARGGAEVSPLREYRGHTKVVATMAALSGGRLATGSIDFTIRVWEVETGVCVATLTDNLSWVYTLAVVGEHTLVSDGYEVLCVWDTRSYTAVAAVPVRSEVKRLLRLSDGGVASGHNDGVVRVWDVARWEAVGEVCGGTQEVRGLAEVWDGRVVSVDCVGVVRLWDVATRTRVGVIKTARRSTCTCCVTLDGSVLLGTIGGRVLVVGFPWARRGAAVVGWAAMWAGVWA